jgi:hypothetical protein
MLNMIASTLAIGWEWSKIGRILGVSPWRWPKKRSGLPVVFPFKKRCELLASLATKEPHRSQSDLQGKTSGGLNVPAIYPPVIQQFAMQVLAEKNMMAYLALRITQR